MNPIKLPPGGVAAQMGLKPAGMRVEKQEYGAVRPAADAKEQAQMKQACRDFESVFLNHMLSKMRESVPKSDLFGNSGGEDLYRGMLDEEMARQISAGGGIGLAEVLFRQIVERGEAAGAGPTGTTGKEG